MQSKLMQSLDQIVKEKDYSSYVAVSNILNDMQPQDSGMKTLKISILRNFTIEPLIAVIKAEVARLGLFPQVYLGDHDTIMVDVINKESSFYKHQADIIILAQWLEDMAPALVNRFVSLSPQQIDELLNHVIETIKQQLKHIRQNTDKVIIINTFALPTAVTMGILDGNSVNNQAGCIRRLNDEVRALAQESTNTYVIDYDYLMSQIGYDRSFDERYWRVGKAPISRHAVLPISLEYVKFIRALCAKSYKCLILDCDNTLWGGIIGEDGLNGIKLDATYPGSCYIIFQNEILNLHDKGVILALCSKNNEADVLDVLNNHPNMILREEHFAARKINWEDKAVNIQKLAVELNIGLDSMVFVDDNPYEIGLINHQLPEVETLLLPKEASQFRSALLRNGYFDTLSVTEEDGRRNQMYRDEGKRKKLAEKAQSIESYLKNLEMIVTVGRPTDFQIPRVAQLTQKTNQFNLTTKRYTDADIRNFINDKNNKVYFVQLQDKVSDLGIIGVAICRYDKETAEIDSFLLSCRALSRNVEDVLLTTIINDCLKVGIKLIKAEFIATKKNQQTSSFYKNQGFHKVSDQNGCTGWELDVNQERVYPEWVTVKENI